MAVKPESWIKPLPQGLFVEPGGFFVDPVRAADRAVITHGHGDHARPGNARVLATEGTIAIMRSRLGEGTSFQFTLPLAAGPAAEEPPPREEHGAPPPPATGGGVDGPPQASTPARTRFRIIRRA